MMTLWQPGQINIESKLLDLELLELIFILKLYSSLYFKSREFTLGKMKILHGIENLREI